MDWKRNMNQDGKKETYQSIASELVSARAEYTKGRLIQAFQSWKIMPWDGSEPFRELDEKRYARQERSLLILSHMPPSPKRFAALCGTLTRGLRAAYEPPVDKELARRHWLSACLELLGQDPLVSDLNGWKTSLTIHDAQMMAQFFSRSIGAMFRWADAFRQAATRDEAATRGGLVAAIYATFAEGHAFVEDGEALCTVSSDLIIRENESGHLRLDNRNIYALLNQCAHFHVAAEYAKMRCEDKEARRNVAVGNLGLEFDPVYLCQENNGRMALCLKALHDRYFAYIDTKDIDRKKALFTFDARNNDWLDYYCYEYGTPAEMLLPAAKLDDADLKILSDNFKRLADVTLVICCAVHKDAQGSPEAEQMVLEWNRLRNRFAARCVGKPMPSYAEQIAFTADLAEFFNTFENAVQTICTNASGAARNSPPAPPPTKKNAKHGLRGTSKWKGKTIRNCISISAACDVITVNGTDYRITGYEAWVRINRLLKPFAARSLKFVPFTAEDREHFHRGDGFKFIDECVFRRKIGRAYALARIRKAVVSKQQLIDEQAGLA